MPTPDTETLAARLRAVERALTDDSATLDPPPRAPIGGPGRDEVCTDRPRRDEPSADSSTAESEDLDGVHPADGHDESLEAVRERLRGLEAAVQALRAALDEGTADGGRGPAREPSSEKAPADRSGADPTPRRCVGPQGNIESSRGAPDVGEWPDDLAAE